MQGETRGQSVRDGYRSRSVISVECIQGSVQYNDDRYVIAIQDAPKIHKKVERVYEVCCIVFPHKVASVVEEVAATHQD